MQIRLRCLVVVFGLFACACSSTTSTGGGGGGCDDIESNYLVAATASSAATCSSPSDCSSDLGLCKSDGARVIGNAKGVYSSTTVAKLKQLGDQWKSQNCGGASCQGSAGGTLDCQSGQCKAL
jgi:hypothetical protein